LLGTLSIKLTDTKDDRKKFLENWPRQLQESFFPAETIFSSYLFCNVSFKWAFMHEVTHPSPFLSLSQTLSRSHALTLSLSPSFLRCLLSFLCFDPF
jgi:hypothetical protein